MTRTQMSISQFLFPILSVFLLVSGMAGPYTIQFSLGVILLGFFYSIYLILSKKIILWGLINITLILFIIVGGLILYISMVASGV